MDEDLTLAGKFSQAALRDNERAIEGLKARLEVQEAKISREDDLLDEISLLNKEIVSLRYRLGRANRTLDQIRELAE